MTAYAFVPVIETRSALRGTEKTWAAGWVAKAWLLEISEAVVEAAAARALSDFSGGRFDSKGMVRGAEDCRSVAEGTEGPGVGPEASSVREPPGDGFP